MTHIDTGTYGAKRQSWRPDNPRVWLKKLLEQNPKASKEELLEIFSTSILQKANQSLLLTIIEYWFANNLHSLLAGDDELKKEFAAPTKDKIKRQIKAKIELAAGTILMNTIMPNNKKLGDCIGSEVAVFGGWLSAVASHMQPSAKVARTFTEEELRTLFVDNS